MFWIISKNFIVVEIYKGLSFWLFFFIVYGSLMVMEYYFIVICYFKVVNVIYVYNEKVKIFYLFEVMFKRFGEGN